MTFQEWWDTRPLDTDLTCREIAATAWIAAQSNRVEVDFKFEPLGVDFEQILHDNRWELYER